MGILKISAIILATAVVVMYLPTLFQPKVPSTVHGSCTPQFEPVMNEFRKNLEAGNEKGAALSVYQNGKKVCDLWGGYKDHNTQEPWQENTMGVFYSTTKGIAATCLLILYDRGLLDYDKLVSHYWPEFAQNGKKDVTVRQLVSHQAGLAWVEEPFTYSDIKNNPEKVAQILAKAKPNWELGTGHGYHAITFGLYVDQLIRRIDPKHRSIGQFVKDEIATPLDVDFYIGTPTAEHYRVATWKEGGLFQMIYQILFIPGIFQLYMKMMITPDPIVAGAFSNPSVPVQSYLQWTEAWELEQASVLGIGTARAMAKIYGVLSNDGMHGGKKFLSEKTIKKYQEIVSSGTDKLLGVNMTFGYGMHHSSVGKDNGIGHLGYGGQLGFAFPQLGLGIGYVNNYHSLHYMELDDPRYKDLMPTVLKCAKK